MGVLANVFGGSGQFGGGPTAVTAQNLTNEGFDLTKPFIQDVLEASRAQFFEDVEDPDTGDTVQQLRAFDQFTGPRIADFAPEQQEAFTGLAALGREGLASTDLGRSPQFFQQAKEKAGLGSLGFTEADADRLMNPFLRGVTDTAKREAVRQFESTVQPQLRAEAVRAGQFGGSRAAILEAEAQRNLQQQLSDIEERGLATSFEQAQRAFEAEKARELQSAGLFSQLGEAVPAQAARELALLSTVGEAQQAQEQAALNLAERDFIEQREFPLRQLQEFQSLVRGFPFTPSTYQVTTQQQPQPSFGQQLLGTLGTGVGLFGALGGFKNKAGGQVVPRQSGGQVRGGLAGLERHQNNVPMAPRPRSKPNLVPQLNVQSMPSATPSISQLILQGTPRMPLGLKSPQVSARQAYLDSITPIREELRQARLDATKLTPEQKLYRSKLKDIDFDKRREDIKTTAEKDIESIGDNKWLRIMNLGLATLGQEGGVSGLQAVGKASKEIGFVDGLLDDAKDEREVARKQRDDLLKIDDQELLNTAARANISKEDQKNIVNARIANLDSTIKEATDVLNLQDQIQAIEKGQRAESRDVAKLLLDEKTLNNAAKKLENDVQDKDDLTSAEYGQIQKRVGKDFGFMFDEKTGSYKFKGQTIKEDDPRFAKINLTIRSMIRRAGYTGKLPEAQDESTIRTMKRTVPGLALVSDANVLTLANVINNPNGEAEIDNFLRQLPTAIADKIKKEDLMNIRLGK